MLIWRSRSHGRRGEVAGWGSVALWTSPSTQISAQIWDILSPKEVESPARLLHLLSGTMAIREPPHA